jgi:protein ATS1
MSPVLLACGSNGAGQLALGHTEDVSLFTACKVDPSCGTITYIHDLVSAASHALLLASTTTEGVETEYKLLGAGTNTHGQLGLQCALSDGPQSETTFRPITLNRAACPDWVPVKIAATWTSSFVVYEHPETREQKVVACGSNDFGELGSTGASGVVTVDLQLAPGERIEHLAGGQRHIVAVISRGEAQHIIGWGAARRGELSATPLPLPAATAQGKGKGKAPARPASLPPTPILATPPGTRIKALSIGAAHSLALLSTGRVLAWGSDGKGQIAGLGHVAGARHLGAAWGSSYILDEGLWSQGANSHGQLLRTADGPGRLRVPLRAVPTALSAGSEHVLVAAREICVSDASDRSGTTTTTTATATAATTDGALPLSLYAGGWNEHGNLGLGDTIDRPRLTKVPNLDGAVIAMWTGCAASWIWLEPPTPRASAPAQ